MAVRLEISAITNRSQIVVVDGTRTNPTSIISIVQQISNINIIERIHNTIILKRDLNFMEGFLHIPDYITVVCTDTGNIVNHAKSSTSSANGILLEGGAVIKILGSGTLGVFGEKVQGGTGTYATTRRGTISPIIMQYSGDRYDTFMSGWEGLTASQVANVLYEIEGLDIILFDGTNIKWASTHPNSFIRNIQVITGTLYNNAVYTALQVNYGVRLTGVRVPNFSVDGMPINVGLSIIDSPYFGITSIQDLKGHLWAGKIKIVDKTFGVGGGWTGSITSPKATEGAELRVVNTLNVECLKGNEKVAGTKIIIIPTKTGTHALSNNAEEFIRVSNDTGGIVATELIEREYFPVPANDGVSTPANTSWQYRILARSLGNNTEFEVYPNQLFTGKIETTLQHTTDENFSNTYTTATGSITGISFSNELKQIHISGTFTLDQLYDAIKWYLYQDGNLKVNSFITRTGTTFIVGDWNIITYTGAIINTGTKFTRIETTGSITIQGGTINVPYKDTSGVLVRINEVEVGDKLGFGNGSNYFMTNTNGFDNVADMVEVGATGSYDIRLPADTDITIVLKRLHHPLSVTNINTGEGLSITPIIREYENYNKDLVLTTEDKDFITLLGGTMIFSNYQHDFAFQINNTHQLSTPDKMKNVLDYLLSTLQGSKMLASHLTTNNPTNDNFDYKFEQNAIVVNGVETGDGSHFYIIKKSNIALSQNIFTQLHFKNWDGTAYVPPTPPIISGFVGSNNGAVINTTPSSVNLITATDLESVKLSFVEAMKQTEVPADIKKVNGVPVTNIDDFIGSSIGGSTGGGLDKVMVTGFTDNANGEYIKLPDAVARALVFSGDFNPDGNTTEVDYTKGVYSNGNGWYLWYRIGSGWHCTRVGVLGLWFFEKIVEGETFAEYVSQVKVWASATINAQQNIPFEEQVNADISAFDGETSNLAKVITALVTQLNAKI